MDDTRTPPEPNRDDEVRGKRTRDEAHERAARDAAGADAPGPADGDHGGEYGGDPADETAILRHELSVARDELERAEADMKDVRDRWLRARADLENFRRRAEAERERAREAGMDAALLPVLTVYDDLARALQAAESADPASIVPGVRQVRDELVRQLAALDVELVGAEGEPFDPDLHEALSTAPASDPALADTIAQVFQVGFRASGRLVRPARVIVYQA